jgi:hypothetical protein
VFCRGKIRAEEEILKIIGEKESLAPELAVAENKKNDIEKNSPIWRKKRAWFRNG